MRALAFRAFALRGLALISAMLIALAPRAWAQSALPDLGSAGDLELSPQMERRLGESIVRFLPAGPEGRPELVAEVLA